MQITMREAILQGKNFEFEGSKYNMRAGTLYEKDEACILVFWILKNQDKLVEVEDNYWDSDGRAIRELEDDMEYHYITTPLTTYKTTNGRHYLDESNFLTGNMFKDKTSAEAELQRLKDLQTKRMEK